jgi:cyclophilin family peptidyl-prolyl cis-trans isomerase
VSDRNPAPPAPRPPFSLAAGALLIGGLVVAIIFINKANGPAAASVAATASASPAASASASPAAQLPFADCTKATFGPPLKPAGEPSDPHVYSAAPAMQIDTTKLYEATIKTAGGNIVLCLQPNLAPVTVNNFVTLARNHFYDGLKFHRVVADFIIQGGDPKGDGSGGPSYKFKDERVRQQYVEGAVAMANNGVNTNGSQFFICTADDTTKLQPLYNLFGQVASGLDVALAIKQGNVMTSVTVTEQA